MYLQTKALTFYQPAWRRAELRQRACGCLHCCQRQRSKRLKPFAGVRWPRNGSARPCRADASTLPSSRHLSLSVDRLYEAGKVSHQNCEPMEFRYLLLIPRFARYPGNFSLGARRNL